MRASSCTCADMRKLVPAYTFGGRHQAPELLLLLLMLMLTCSSMKWLELWYTLHFLQPQQQSPHLQSCCCCLCWQLIHRKDCCRAHTEAGCTSTRSVVQPSDRRTSRGPDWCYGLSCNPSPLPAETRTYVGSCKAMPRRSTTLPEHYRW